MVFLLTPRRCMVKPVVIRLFPSRRAGLWCFYSPATVLVISAQYTRRVSIPASGIVVFLRKKPGGNPTNQEGFHPGERDCGVSTMVKNCPLIIGRMVSIPASGIVVFLPRTAPTNHTAGKLFPSRRAGLWCFYPRAGHCVSATM